MEEVFTSIPFLAVVAVVMVGAVSVTTAVMRRRTSIRLMAEYNPGDILLSAEDVNLAEHSTPGARSTGNGTLLLTPEELAFRNWDGQSMKVPLRAILRIEGTQLTMRGRNMRPLLRVYFTGAEGEEERAAWLLQGAEKWVQRIELVRSR